MSIVAHLPFLAPALIAVCTILRASPVLAQSAAAPVAHPYRLLIGGFFPVDGSIKRSVGSAFYSFGGDYDLYSPGAGGLFTVGAYLDYDTKSRLQETANVSLTEYGGGAYARARLGPAGRPIRPYFGVAGGYYDVNVHAYSILTDENFHIDENFSRFGAKLLLGCEFGPGPFIEADYTLLGHIPATDPSGCHFRVGYQF